MLNKDALGAQQVAFYTGFGLISILSLLGAAYLQEYLLALIPFAIALGYATLLDFRFVYYVLLFFLPLSIEYYFGGRQLATDLPTEPLMIGLMFVMFVYLLLKPELLKKPFITHPIILILGLHYFWTFFTSITSENIFVSIKFFLAKTWYIAVFVFLTGLIIKDTKTFRTAFWVIFIPLLCITLVTLGRQALDNFSFGDVNDAVMPYFRNHVNYAAHLSMIFPFLWIAAYWYKKGSLIRGFLLVCRLIFLVAIYFSYTRACWLALIVAAIAYFTLNANWLPYALIASFLIIMGFFAYMNHMNTFMNLAPSYRHTITHKNFSDHLVATYQLEDASSMERFYRWIAAFNMIDKNTILGYGPGNFYPYYQGYTLDSFRTYLSDNEQESTVHNYFLLMLVEQGIIGLLIFMGFTISLFFYCQRLFNNIFERQDRLLATAVILSLVILYVNLMLSDLLEAVKTGTLFFLNIALLVNLDIKHRYGKAGTAHSSNKRNDS